MNKGTYMYYLKNKVSPWCSIQWPKLQYSVEPCWQSRETLKSYFTFPPKVWTEDTPKLEVTTMNQTEVQTKWKPASDPALGKSFVYICETSRELWRTASWEGLPAPRPLSMNVRPGINEPTCERTSERTNEWTSDLFKQSSSLLFIRNSSARWVIKIQTSWQLLWFPRDTLKWIY